MRKVKLYLLPFFIAITIAILPTGKVHTNPAAPPAGGVAGDPSRTTCALIGCHPSPENTFGASDLVLNMGNSQGSLSAMAGQTYTPGNTYYIEFNPTLTNGNYTVYGFQMTCLDAASNMAGSFTILDATTTSAQSLLSRNYVGHKNASDFNDWIFKWTAPATDAGKLTFYYTANIANGNGSTSGDHIYKGTTDVLSGTASGINNLQSNNLPVNIFPNPVHDNVTISLDADKTGVVELLLYSADGKLVQKAAQGISNTGQNTITLPLIKSIPAGIYYLQTQLNDSRNTGKLIIY